MTRVPFLFRGILLRPQESRSDGVCATNLAIQEPPPLEIEPGLSDTLIQAVWKLTSISLGGLRTAQKRKNKVPLDVIAYRETTHAPVVAALGAERACNSMSFFAVNTIFLVGNTQ